MGYDHGPHGRLEEPDEEFQDDDESDHFAAYKEEWERKLIEDFDLEMLEQAEVRNVGRGVRDAA